MRNLAQVDCINWGIIGCGDVTEVKSGPAFNKVDHSRLVAVMRRDIEKLKDYVKRHRVPKFYTNAQALIDDPEIDAVYIATPPDSHCDYALKVAKAGKVCYVEKPMALNYTQCQIMIEAFEAAKTPLFVAYYRRSLPRFQQVKAWLETGLIGEVRHVDWRYFAPPQKRDTTENNWRVNPKIAGGGYFVDLASHGIDLLMHMLGPIKEVSGYSRNQARRYSAEDAVVANMVFASGATGCGAWNFGSYRFSDKVTILGNHGNIEFSVFEDNPIAIESSLLNQTRNIPHPENVQLPHIQNIVKYLRNQGAQPSLGKESAETSRIMDKILSQPK